MNTLEKLFRRNQGFSLPFLIHLYSESGSISMYYVNKTDSAVTFENKEYSPSSFDYKPNMSTYGFDGGGKLEITVQNNQVIDLVEGSNGVFLDVVACMNEGGEFTKLQNFHHHYGAVSANRKTVTFTFEKDDRLDMTFPTLIWNTQNNRGNS